MKTLYLIRHAKAKEADLKTNDIKRTLTARGKEDSKMMAEELKNKLHEKVTIVCSDATRSLQTARVFAKVLNVEREHIIQRKSVYSSKSATDLLKDVNSFDDSNNCVLIFGHNPSITELLNNLCNETFVSIPTCAVAKIEFDVDDWNEVSFGTGKSIFLDIPKNHKV